MVIPTVPPPPSCARFPRNPESRRCCVQSEDGHGDGRLELDERTNRFRGRLQGGALLCCSGWTHTRPRNCWAFRDRVPVRAAFVPRGGEGADWVPKLALLAVYHCCYTRTTVATRGSVVFFFVLICFLRVFCFEGYVARGIAPFAQASGTFFFLVRQSGKGVGSVRRASFENPFLPSPWTSGVSFGMRNQNGETLHFTR